MKVMCEIQPMCTSPKGLPSQKDLWQITTLMACLTMQSITFYAQRCEVKYTYY